MSKTNDIQVVKKLLEHKDFGLMCLLKDFLGIEGFYSDLGIFLSREDILYLSFFFKAKGCGNIIYKLNISIDSNSSSEREYLFCVGFNKNNPADFDEDGAKLMEIKDKITAQKRPVKLINGSKNMIPLGVYDASNLPELVKDILKNFNYVKPADVSRTDFITLTKAKKMVLEQFKHSR